MAHPQSPELEKRKSQRLALKTAVNLSSESNFYTGFSNDISEGGIFVATYETLPMGLKVDLEFSLPDDDEPIKALGEVRWVREDGASNEADPGLGLAFLNLSNADRKRIDNFLFHRDTIFYED